MFKKLSIIMLSLLSITNLMVISASVDKDIANPVEIYFFPGGSPDRTFVTILYRGIIYEYC